MAGGAGAWERALSDAAVEPSPVSHAGKLFAIALLVVLAWAAAPVAEAQKPIRIGASVAQTGAYAEAGQNLLRGYQLCVKHLNERGGALGRKLGLVVTTTGRTPPRLSVSMKSSSRRTRWIWCSVRTPRRSPTPWPT